MFAANLPHDARPSRSPWGAVFFWLGTLGFLAVVGAGVVITTGCDSSPCNTDPGANPAVDFRGGEVEGSGDSQVYETSPPDGAHLNFSAGTRYKIYHQLSGRPQIVQPWVSFSSGGTTTGNEAVPAGNMVEILEVNDQYVHLQNNSCADYWLRVVAGSPSKVPSPPNDSRLLVAVFRGWGAWPDRPAERRLAPLSRGGLRRARCSPRSTD